MANVDPVYKPAITFISGQSVSDAIAIGVLGASGVAVAIPSGWTAADIGFQVSDDNVASASLITNWYTLKDETGTPVKISSIATAEANMYLAPASVVTGLNFRWLRLVSRSVSNFATPVNQADGNKVLTFSALSESPGSSSSVSVTATTSPILAAGEAHVGQVGGHTPRVTATYARPADNTAYSIGDIIGNSGTANLVVPITFSNAARISGGSGRISGARCTVTAASGTIVLPAFDLLIFRPEASIPFAAAGYPADNAALNISAAAMKELVAVLSFSATAWRNQAGGATAAGDHIWQTAVPTVRQFAPFNLASIPSASLVALMQAQNAWTPTGVVNTFDFALDCDCD